MTYENLQAYGLWTLVVFNSLIFIIFAFSFAKPQSRRDWRSFGPFHLLSAVFIGGGFWLLSVAFVLIMFGILLQWPTLVTLAKFPILCFMYFRLSLTEGRDSARRYGADWERYASRTPRFIPAFSTWGAARPTC